MSALIDGNPAYQAVKLIRVDWDQFGQSEIVSELKIPRRSTLVMFKDGAEIGRVVAQTAASAIEPLFVDAIS